MNREEWDAFYRQARANTQTPSLNYRNPSNYTLAHLYHNGKEYSLRTIRTIDGFRQTDVIPNTFWQSASGRQASLYGALPWWTDAQKQSEGWRKVTDGWTIRDNNSGTIGGYNVDSRDETAVRALAHRMNTDRRNAQEACRRMVDATSTPLVWTRSEGNDGLTVWHSGEGYSIAMRGARYAPVCPDGEELFPMGTLTKAKAWCAARITEDRRRAYMTAA